MKKWAFLAIALSLSLGTIGCTEEKPVTPVPNTTTTPSTTPTTDTDGDGDTDAP